MTQPDTGNSSEQITRKSTDMDPDDYMATDEPFDHHTQTIYESDDDDVNTPSITGISSAASQPPQVPQPSAFASPTRRSRRRSILNRPSKPRAIRTPSSPMATTLPNNNLPSAPASPPTPAPSPSPHRRLPDWSTADESEEAWNKNIREAFKEAPAAQQERILAELLNLCNSRQLQFVHEFVCPRLKKDPFTTLPNEICLRVLSFVDHPKTLARSSQVSRRWHDLVNDDMAWKTLCETHAYRRMSGDSENDWKNVMMSNPSPTALAQFNPPRNTAYATAAAASLAANPSSSSSSTTTHPYGLVANSTLNSTFMPSPSAPHDLPPSAHSSSRSTPTRPGAPGEYSGAHSHARHISYRSHFKRRYMVETAWRSGGRVSSRQITPDQGVVTSLHLTDKYIVVALDNAKIHVFDAQGAHQKTLHGHLMGVWAMVPWGDTLVSGGCDRDVRVWNMASGQAVHILRGHSSTVRCLRMSDANTAITGSRDTTLRIWDINKGFCKHVLVGHQASVRCVEVHGDLIASGSYDTTARIWSISEGKCLRTLHGHFSQIYAIAFDGKRVATGSLDTSVRIWDATDGKCLHILQGHTSLVGQLQMRGDTLVTGGSDGSVRVWSLERFVPIHRLAAHDNSVTSLQFNESRIISGGSDGRVKVWDLKTGNLVRELSQPADAVWRVVFEEEKAIIMASRNLRTFMEVWSFAPLPEALQELDRSGSPSNMAVGAVEFSEHDSSDMKDVEMADVAGSVGGASGQTTGASERNSRKRLSTQP